jgi:hydroxyacylglutathione hydrolase
LYDSLHEKLLKLPDYCEVYPAHGAGSLCGRAMGAKWRTTIGYERKYNAALQITDKKEFMKSLTTNMPPAPDHFSRCSDINRKGPILTSKLPSLKEIDSTKFKEEIKNKNNIVLDARRYDAFGSQHIPGAWHIDSGGNFPTFAGWVLPTDKNILLVASSHNEALEANIWARRVGIDSITGYLDGGMFGWVVAGYRTSNVQQISAEDLHDMITGKSSIVVLDVRAPAEFEDNHIEGAINIPAPELRTRFQELNTEKATVMICSTGNRSSLGASILNQHGFKNIFNVAGGMTGYSAAGYTQSCKVCENPHGSRYFTRYVQSRPRWKL